MELAREGYCAKTTKKVSIFAILIFQVTSLKLSFFKDLLINFEAVEGETERDMPKHTPLGAQRGMQGWIT